MAMFTNTPEKSPAITVNNYGKGRAIYVSVPSQMSVLAPLVRSLYSTLDIEKGPETPDGVYARVVDGRTLYVNTTGDEKTVAIGRNKRGIVSGTSYEGVVRLKPYDADLVERRSLATSTVEEGRGQATPSLRYRTRKKLRR